MLIEYAHNDEIRDHAIMTISVQIEFTSLFQTPTLNELEMLATNTNGSPIKLNDPQLEAVKQTGFI